MIQTRLPVDSRPAQNSLIEHRAHPDPSVAPQRHPILIGISGKRIFDNTNVEADRAIAEDLADRFRTLFEALEQALPDSP
jgi:hypothetical protein